MPAEFEEIAVMDRSTGAAPQVFNNYTVMHNHQWLDAP